MRKVLLLVLGFLAMRAGAQQVFEVRGLVSDTAVKPLKGATVKINFASDSLQASTDEKGAFSFKEINRDSFTLTITFTGLEPFIQAYQKTSKSPVFNVPQVVMVPSAGLLEGVVIRSVRPVIIKEDTVQYDVSAYKVREGAPVEDVIKKLPGVTVDKDGNIETQGKKVARVRVNGKDYFGGDVQTATQNLPADVIDNIQIIDDYGDAANLSGIKEGEPEKIININTKRDKNRGTFGNATVAAGNEDRYAGNIFINNFKDDRQVSLLASINNTNANLFNFNGGGRGGGGRGANLGSGDRGGWGGAGITTTRSIGLNFRNKWGKKLSVYGSYSYSSRNSRIESETFSEDNTLNRTSLRRSSSRSSGSNHRITWNMEYAMDSLNYFKFSPYVSLSNSENSSANVSNVARAKRYTISNGISSNESQSPNAGGSLLFNHRFTRRGRNFSASASMDFSKNDADRYTNNKYDYIDSNVAPVSFRDTIQEQQIGTATRNSRVNAHLSYQEPLNATGTTLLELNYDWNQSETRSDRDVFDLADPAHPGPYYNTDQSNHYNYTFITNKAGISLKGNRKKYNYSVGFQSQPSSLSGRSVDKNANTSYRNLNWIPSARFVYNFARSNSLTATINGVAREPNFMQLQPVVDSSNLNNVVYGNPNLKNDFTNTVALRYNRFDAKSGSSFFANVSYDKTSDKIVTSRFIQEDSTGTNTTYVNTDGFYGYNGNVSYTRPFDKRKYTAGVSMAASFDNNISFTDGYRNKGKNWNLRPGANFRLDLQNIVDLTLRGDYVFYQTVTRRKEGSIERKAKTLNLGLNGKNYFKDLTIGYDFTKTINYGFSSSVATNPSILSVYTEYRMLKGKKLTLRLQGFDLLNQNTGISRTMNESTVTDSRVNRLARYFLLSANLRLSKFAGGTSRNMRRERTGGENF